MSFWKAQADRISEWGFLRTFNYYLFGVLLNKLGITICVAYQHEGNIGSTDAPAGTTFTLLDSWSDWTDRDLHILQSCDDASRLDVFRQYAAIGDACVVARSQNGDLAGYTWVGPRTDFPMARGERVSYVHDGTTYPAYRGKGIFPIMLVAACAAARKQQAEALPIVADILVVNYASRRGVEKVGFVPCGYILRLRKWAWVWSSKAARRPAKTYDVAAR
jgi:RimJ/RimL family protein N-acetyltransferase